MSRNFELLQEMEQSRMGSTGGIAETSGCLPSELPLEHRSDGRVLPFQSAADEALRLVQNIFLLQTQSAPRTVVFAGIDHGNGCSHVAASVAQCLAAGGHGPVCLVEANFRSPGLPAILGATNHHGLTDALLNEGGIRSFVKAIPIEQDVQDGKGRLSLLSSGSVASDSPKLLNSERLKERLAELRKDFRFLVVDAPPILRYPDAITLGQLSDGIVLILEAEATRREAATVAMDHLRSSRIPVLAAVLNKRTFPIPEAIYKRL